MAILTGYSGSALRLLSDNNVSIGNTVRVLTSEGEYSGILMPRYEFSDDSHIVVKLKSGYNVGIEVNRITALEKIEAPETEINKGEKLKPKIDKKLPKLALISTGGTIASKIDYRTGGVRAAISAEELYAAVPELSSYAIIDTEVLLSEYSENLTPRNWSEMASRVGEKVQQGYEGVVLTHGTDTMHYSAAALSFALNGIPVPVVLVGAQRSSDRPSSDAALNLIGATRFAAQANVCGVFVAMHNSIDDDLVAVHLGTRVRKNHTSRRDAFESIDVSPAALIGNDEIKIKMNFLPERKKSDHFNLRPNFEERVTLLKFHPGLDPRIIDHLIETGCRGIVLEGTGLGHIGKQSFDAIRRAIEKGIMVCMTSQCIWGRVGMTVYETGRDLLRIGVLPLSNMISETALAKLMWVFGNTKDLEKAKELMKENIAMEYFDRSEFD